MPSWHDAQLKKKAQGQLYLYLYDMYTVLYSLLADSAHNSVMSSQLHSSMY